MEIGTLLFLLILLACPLMMVWMMRGHGGHASHGDSDGGHASHGAGHGCGHGGDVSDAPATTSLEELRRRRDELDAEIERLEQPKPETPAAV